MSLEDCPRLNVDRRSEIGTRARACSRTHESFINETRSADDLPRRSRETVVLGASAQNWMFLSKCLDTGSTCDLKFAYRTRPVTKASFYPRILRPIRNQFFVLKCLVTFFLCA